MEQVSPLIPGRLGGRVTFHLMFILRNSCRLAETETEHVSKMRHAARRASSACSYFFISMSIKN